MNADTKKETNEDSPKSDEKNDKNSNTEDDEDNDEEGVDGEEEESGDDIDGVAAEPLATTRSRRTNAGNRMSKMIQDEEDEFYKNLYGGFHEEDDDMDFDSEEEADGEEVEDDYDVDSDFSIDETDEIAPEHQAVAEEPKRKRGVYRDPKPKGSSLATYSGLSGPATTSTSTPTIKPKASSSSTPLSPNKISRAERSFRDSTRKKTEETIKNFQTGSKRKRKKRRNPQAWKPLTQEELLAEARVTEEENLKSLETYQRLESERLKKIKQIKKSLPLPYVTYTSTTMPDLKEKDPDGKTKYYSRNFMTFFK